MAEMTLSTTTPALEAEQVEVVYGKARAVNGATVRVSDGSITAIVGPNGAGKTSLLETMLGSREAVAGRARLGHGVQPAYFSQHTVNLDERGSVLECAQRATGLSRPDAQALLGRFLFTGWDTHRKPVSVLSGGERRRLALALLVASGANLLVLDEPTNHLDLESREALEAALEAFPGTVLLVSHDRALVDAVAERTLAIEDGAVRSYDGGWADYVRRRAELERPAPPAPEPRVKRVTKGPVQAQPKREPSELEVVEAEIADHEEAVAALEQELGRDWTNADTLAAHRRARDELQALLARWETLFEEAQT